MRRCFDLALLGSKNVKSNPNVGAVLVHNDRIIGEGYYQYYGGQHAERNALRSVKSEDKHLIKSSTLYVSLEPCCIHGKTPPCTDLINEKGIKNLVISVEDPNPKIKGEGLEKLNAAGVTITKGILQAEGLGIIKPFIANLAQRPYIILKFAQSSDAYFGKRGKSVWLSNQWSKVQVHKWRSEVDGILIGYNTAVTDNPELTTRAYPGDNPNRIVIDKNLSSNHNLKLWSDKIATTFVTDNSEKIAYPKDTLIMNNWEEFNLKELLSSLYKKGVFRLLIEGGADTIKRFADQDLWDEARILKTDKVLKSGIRAPIIKGQKSNVYRLENDLIEIIHR